MPSAIPQTTIPRHIFTSSRPPLDDELYVMGRYAAHASHCEPCAQPTNTLISKGETLCSRGIRHARNLAQYIQVKNGKIYSTSITDQSPKQIDIPSEYRIIRELLHALDQRLMGQKRTPVVIIHDDRNTNTRSPYDITDEPFTPTSSKPALLRRSTISAGTATQLIQPARSNKRAYEDRYAYRRDSPSSGDLVTTRTHSSNPRVRVPHQYLH